jgi:O-antigen ligase
MNPYTLLLAAILLLSGVTDFTRKLAIGSLTFQGVLTIGLGVGTLLLVVARRRLPKAVFMASWLVLFLGIGVLSVYLNRATALISFRDQAQNLLVYGLFVGAMLMSATESHANPIAPPWYLSHGFTRAAQISMAFYGVSLLVGGLGTSVWMSARSFSIFAVIAVAWCLAGWRYKAFPNAGLYAIGLTVLIALSFSRTSTVVALLMFPLAQASPRDPRSWGRVGAWVMAIMLVAYLTFTFVEPIRARFLAKGDNASVGGIQVNTSGRDSIWKAVQDSAAESPWVGKGPGSSGIAVQKVNETVHPHNDYLRLLHDFGGLGLGIWILGYGGLLIQAWRNWFWAEKYDRVTAHIHAAAVLAMLVVAFVMITDNVVVYLFAMAPLGILIGASIGSGSARQKLLRQSQPLAWMEDWAITDDGQPNLTN